MSADKGYEFWGISVAGRLIICPVLRDFHVCKAVLSDPAVLEPGKVVTLSFERLNICKFVHGQPSETRLDFTVKRGANITFETFGLPLGSPSPTIHLSGYHPPAEAAVTSPQQMKALLSEWKDSVIVQLAETPAAKKMKTVEEKTNALTTTVDRLQQTVDNLQAFNNEIKTFARGVVTEPSDKT